MIVILTALSITVCRSQAVVNRLCEGDNFWVRTSRNKPIASRTVRHDDAGTARVDGTKKKVRFKRLTWPIHNEYDAAENPRSLLTLGGF